MNEIHLNSHSNGNGHSQIQSSDELLDLLCIGFGPASLAIAIALHDTQDLLSPSPKALFLEKQPHFAWHAGMQLPGARMQISFLKDLATPRNPRSKFTFINYLFEKGRLNQFINLSTFLPTRVEFEDYLRWCAEHFEREGRVGYGMEVESVRPSDKNSERKVTSWEVTALDTRTGNSVIRRARHVVIAIGGRPVVPQNMQGLKHVAHSSQFASTITQIQQREEGRKLRFAVIGSGQSAAEIFNDLWERFPDAEVKLVIRGASLRPSDDSPFVNEIFDPDRVDGIYNQPPCERAVAIALDKATNYGVVRLELLEHLYQKRYMQRLESSDESKWRCRIIPNRTVISASQSSKSSMVLRLGEPDESKREEAGLEEMEVDYVFTATGYVRNAHEDMLSEVRHLLPQELQKEGKFKVRRDYSVIFDGDEVDGGAGVWLQGCNEGTHGLSDTLLSILAVRGGELVKSIFGDAGAESGVSEA
ncbi:L-ornithine N5-oxygenase sida [Hyaloscypha hepaticicola]|uniref:L-ornithine N(5)-monooxygenase [NAD(P)H] n=1 Tax=Hyaloscypha hepaticicola TaxID=2082293 RepID=A0A2J6PY67_9HELO|nr:L-ornithine N5-oxygenase sida [Hyaloscypha hepaticicola]